MHSRAWDTTSQHAIYGKALDAWTVLASTTLYSQFTCRRRTPSKLRLTQYHRNLPSGSPGQLSHRLPVGAPNWVSKPMWMSMVLTRLPKAWPTLRNSIVSLGRGSTSMTAHLLSAPLYGNFSDPQSSSQSAFAGSSLTAWCRERDVAHLRAKYRKREDRPCARVTDAPRQD